MPVATYHVRQWEQSPTPSSCGHTAHRMRPPTHISSYSIQEGEFYTLPSPIQMGPYS
jgi:hypothetical protein